LIARRTLLQVASGIMAGGAILQPRVVSAERSFADEIVINPRELPFRARGDFVTDDTKALQAAADQCFGPPANPHGTAAVHSNVPLHIPPGNYKIASPIRLSRLHGARILGAGRFVTKITNAGNGPVFETNGCGYSHFEGLYLEASDNTATIFDLNWDGGAGGAALQSNSFIDMFFSGGGIGVDIGAGGYMGSENIFVNCFWLSQAIAGIKTSNFNALQNTIVGGNFQDCSIGIWVYRGAVPLVESVGFQLTKEWDIRVDNSANDSLTVIGCRTESSNFVSLKNGVHSLIVACTQAEAGPPGYFLRPAGCPVTVERCVSLQGQIALSAEARLTVRGSSFGRTDWLSHSALNSGQAIEVEDVAFGGTPNSKGAGPSGRIARQRITDAGVFEYQLAALE
jgi:hypothetical protein